MDPVLEVRDLVVEYSGAEGGARSSRAVDGVSFDLHPGDSIALIGESGCGKTTLALALLRLLPKMGSVTSGSVHYRRRDGSIVDILALSGREVRSFRWAEAAIVFQGAMNSFNPVLKIQDQMLDTVRAHQRRVSKKEVWQRSERVLREVDLEPGRVLNAYPHELSGGMRQRVLIALALILEPQILILDEPTTALDILTQRRIIDLIHSLHTRYDFAMMFVSHDLAVAAELASRVATMYRGEMVEVGDVRDVFYRPRHSYTKHLIDSVPTVASGFGSNSPPEHQDGATS